MSSGTFNQARNSELRKTNSESLSSKWNQTYFVAIPFVEQWVHGPLNESLACSRNDIPFTVSMSMTADKVNHSSVWHFLS